MKHIYVNRIVKVAIMADNIVTIVDNIVTIEYCGEKCEGW